MVGPGHGQPGDRGFGGGGTGEVTQAELDSHASDTSSVHGISNTENILFKTLADAKGDLLVGSAADTIVRLAVGADATVLTASSGAANGVAYVHPTIEDVNTVAAAGATETLTDAAYQFVTLDANCTLTFPTAVPGKSFTLVAKQADGNTRTITWPAAVDWQQAAAPVLSSGTGKVDVLTFCSHNGTDWLGFVAGLDMR